MTTIGCDYSSSTLYLACLNNLKVHAIASLNIEDLCHSLDPLKALLHSYHFEYESKREIYIEQPWVNGIRYPRSGLMMMRSATILEVVTIESGLKPVFVHPLTWRKLLFGNGRPSDPKATAVNWVKENCHYDVPVFGKTGKGHRADHNFAEAIAIAHFGEINSSQN